MNLETLTLFGWKFIQVTCQDFLEAQEDEVNIECGQPEPKAPSAFSKLMTREKCVPKKRTKRCSLKNTVIL